MRQVRVAIIGAGVAGLVAAVLLARQGVAVTIFEKEETPGGKIRQVGAARIDGGPTVFTLRGVLDEIFAEAGQALSDHLTLHPAEILARHAWSSSERLDLHADRDHSADAIGAFAGPAAARGYLRFCADAARVYRTLEQPFIRAAAPRLDGLVRGVGLRGLPDLWQIKPFLTLWSALGTYFEDPRLRQLFGRYATYCGSSPFLAPATLMLVAHVEQEGVWLVEGGMHRLAAALADLARALGARIRYGAEVCEIVTEGGRVAGVRLRPGDRIDADAVVLNADVAAVAAGLFGRDAARAAPATPASARSLSAVTWAIEAETEGFPLDRHNVFFSADYAAEFTDIFGRGRLPGEPTVYVCAQDRGAPGPGRPFGPERLLCLVNAPATGDTHPFDAAEIQECEQRTFGLLERCGLRIRRRPETTTVTTPAGFARLFPGTGGALYGQASHGWRASFTRPGVRTRVTGLYQAGGSTHPGPGVPMAALSGRMAAACLLSDFASIRRSGRTVMSGGMSMP